MSDAASTTNHADEGQSADHGGSNVRIHLVGTDKPLMTAIALVASVGIGIVSFVWHQADTAAITAASQVHQDSVREFSEWAAKTYNREVAIDADMQLMGINSRAKYGDIPIPPNAKPKRKEHK